MRFARLTGLFVISAAIAPLTSCSSDDSDGVSRQDCARMRDHMIELRMQSVTADQDQHRAALRSALGETFISSCVELTSASQLRCSLAAAAPAALTACTEP